MAAEHIEEIYEQYVKPLSTVDRLRLVELIAHGLEVTVDQDIPQFAGIRRTRTEDLAGHRSAGICD
jgi:hypothetical protein